MTALESPPEIGGPANSDDLVQLQLRVARRADELARGGDSTRSRDLQLWFQAERDVFAPSQPKEIATTAAGR